MPKKSTTHEQQPQSAPDVADQQQDQQTPPPKPKKKTTRGGRAGKRTQKARAANYNRLQSTRKAQAKADALSAPDSPTPPPASPPPAPSAPLEDVSPRLVAQAIRQGWDIPQTAMKLVPSAMLKIALDLDKQTDPDRVKARTDSERIQSSRVLTVMHAQNQKDEQDAWERERDAIAINARMRADRERALITAPADGDPANPAAAPSQTVNVNILPDLRQAMLADPGYVDYMREKLAKLQAESNGKADNGHS